MKMLPLLRWAALAVAVAGYIVMLHIYTARDTPSTIGALLAIVPMLAVSLLIAWRATHRGVMLSLWFAALALLALNWPLLQSNFALVGLLQHAGTFAMLALFFGRTLQAGDTPIVSRMARQAHGSLPPPLAHYTRRVTQAWTAFFALMAFASVVLFGGGYIALWSWLANLLTPVLIGAMFGAEYLVRRSVLPPELRTGLMDSIRAAWHGTRGDAPAAHRPH
ncbi:MAG: hypothetical protein HYS20_11930 [Rhodocyclales bacterium]|nr:hypothetical protein [Rhodocyclales bacterium]